MKQHTTSVSIAKFKRISTVFSLAITLICGQLPLVYSANAASTAYTKQTETAADNDVESENKANLTLGDQDGQLGYRTTTNAYFDGDTRVPAAELPIIVATSSTRPIPNTASVAQKQKTIKTYSVDMTAYTSSVEECDSTPWTTADGSRTRDGIIAANFLPFGTKVRIPAVFGDKIFEVHDRMNSRYWYRIDVWMLKKQDMRQFGIKHNVKIEVVELGDNSTQWMTWKKMQLAAKAK